MDKDTAGAFLAFCSISSTSHQRFCHGTVLGECGRDYFKLARWYFQESDLEDAGASRGGGGGGTNLHWYPPGVIA